MNTKDISLTTIFNRSTARMYHGCNNETISYSVFYIVRDFYNICRGKYETINVTERTILTATPKSSFIKKSFLILMESFLDHSKKERTEKYDNS
jgi:hypothetical protein